ncbi:MAG TPA: oligosaccharide flippase family protein [Gemmatimonadales bacterium]|nr:oligosaccharide flippase family protein [Gemmatimonadales bacterium]
MWIGGGKVVYAGLRILVLALLARLLSPANFGVIGAALVVVGFSAIFSQLGLAPAIIQRPLLERRHLEAAFSASVLLGVLLGITLWLAAPLAARFFHIPAVAPVLRVLAWIFPLDGLSAIAESQVQRELRFRWLATMEVSTFLVGYGLIGVGLAFLGAGVWALVAGQMAQTTLYTLILIVTRPPVLRLVPDRAAFVELMYYGGGFTASKVANYFALQADNLVVGRWLGAAALGFYGRAYELMAGAPALLGEAVDRVLFPAMASIQQEAQRMAEAYHRGVALMALITLPASAILFVLAPELIRALLGPQWTPVVLPFQILALGMFLRTSYRISDVTARATGAVYRRAWRQLVYALCVLTAAWFGKAWGIAGVAAGVLGALAVNFLLMAHLGLRLTHLTWRSFWHAHAPAVALAAAAGLIAWGAALPLRALAAPPLFVFAVTLLVTIAGVLLLAFGAPRVFFGPDGQWLVAQLGAFLRRRQALLGAAAPAAANGTMPLVRQLGDALRANRIRYCQWKGHGKRERWARGNGDVDLLVDEYDHDRFVDVLRGLGFKPTRSRNGNHRSDDLHYFGLDVATGSLLHLHVRQRLVLGRPWATTYALPLERALLGSAVQNDVFRAPTPELELVVLALHSVARMSWLETWTPGVPRWLVTARAELARLEGKTTRDRLRDALERHVPWVDLAFLDDCLAALRADPPTWRRAAAKLALHRRLRSHAEHPSLTVRLETWRRRLVTLGGMLARPLPPKYNAGGGKIVSLGGGDGAGKTTCAAALHAWLSRDFATMRAHLGKPPKSLTRLGVGAVLRVAKWFDRAGTSAIVRYLEYCYYIATAHDRYRLYVKVRRFATNCGVAICERYPAPENLDLVGPRIARLIHGVPHSRLADFLARVELGYYDRIGFDDLLIILKLDPETAVRRKTTEPADYVRKRAQLVLDKDWTNTRARIVDASRPLPEVVADLKTVIWSAL